MSRGSAVSASDMPAASRGSDPPPRTHRACRVVHAESTGLCLFLPTGTSSYRGRLARFEITLKDRTGELIDGADAYQQEGQMTTFFALSGERLVVDCWSTRLASFRTSEILIVRRRVAADSTTQGASEDQGTYAPSQAIEESATSAPP